MDATIPGSVAEPNHAEPIPALVLTSAQRRVLGCLIEKAFCTPEAYPLTTNATITACNQKSNRAPVLTLEDHQVDEALLDLQKMGLVTRVLSANGRTDRWKQNLKDAWELDRPQRAVLGELLLRGPQSEGDIRAHASRMVDIATLPELRSLLEELARRGAVRRLTPEGRKRGVIWTHLYFAPVEMERIEKQFENSGEEGDDVPTPTNSSSTRSSEPAPPQLTQRMDTLELQLRQLQKSHDELFAAVRRLTDELGGVKPTAP